MPEVSNQGVTIAYEVTGDGPSVLLLHGWCCDHTWWQHAGFVDGLADDYRVVSLDLRGHGASDKPHDPESYRAATVVSDVLAVADAEGIDRFAIWGLSYGGWIGWLVAYAVPERVVGLISTGSWDPRPGTDEDAKEFDETWGAGLRVGGTPGLIEVFKKEQGANYATEFPAWAEATTLQADPEALLAIQSHELITDGVPTLVAFPAPVLLISGEREDEANGAADIAGMVPDGQSLWLPGLGHGGACSASELTLPTARTFLERCFA